MLTSCDSGGANDTPDEPPPPEEEGFQRPDLLANVGGNLIVPAYGLLQTTVDGLASTVDAFAADPSEESLRAAREALKASRLAWQFTNLFQFGPAESVVLRSALNTYPTNVDRVEANVATGTYTLGSIADRPAGGFPALDYLLHGTDEEETMMLFTADANAAARLAYVQDNAAFIKSNVDAVVTQWQAEGGNYTGTFLSEDNAGIDVGSSLGMLINAMVLHYERFLRDGKIGIPAGVRSAGIPRPGTVEVPYGGYSLELAQANMEALERLYLGVGFNGVDGLGLDDNLRALDADELADDIVATLADIRGQLDALSDPLEEQIEQNNDAVLEVFTTMQELVVLIKTDMTSILGVSITFQDTDGD
ncbi:MAG: imelysin family protein [Bacteroidota bacterium]